MHPHTKLINDLIEKKGFTSYLEIGVHDPSQNYDLVKCKFRIGVDPTCYGVTRLPTFTGTSDEFFFDWFNMTDDNEFGHQKCFDIVFIDGLHWSEQVKKDFENSLQCLNDGGMIILHDTSPAREEFACYPRNGLRGRWNGDVYKFIMEGIWRFHGIDFRTVDTDPNGLTIAKRVDGFYGYGESAYPEVNYKTFSENRKEILRLCTIEEFWKWI